jgi:hypothetical protein
MTGGVLPAEAFILREVAGSAPADAACLGEVLRLRLAARSDDGETGGQA